MYPETNNASKAFADLWFYSNPVYATSTAVVDTKTFVIQSASDDVEEWLAPGLGQTQSNPVGDLDYNSSDLELGCEGGSHTDPQMVGLRFSNIDLPQGKYILSAQIDFEVDAVSKQADPCTLVIRVEDADDAATFTTQNQPFLLTSRPKLSDSIVWELKPTELNAVDARGLSVDVAPLVQRILQRSGWKSGNALAFYITGTGTREVESYEGEPTAAAKLHIRYAMNAQEIEAKRLTDSIKAVVAQTYAGLNQAEYTIPSWTEMLRSYVQADGNPTPGSLEEFKQDLVAMKPATLPYNVCIAMNGNPKTQFGLTWYTNQGVNPGVVALVEGVHTDASAFVAPVAFAADTLHLWNVNYSVSRNELQVKAGLENDSKRNYTVHKALVTGLKANTTYSYRVGYEGNWSEIGTFTTAPESADDYSFLYIADTQAHNDDYFTVSERTVKTAAANMPDMKFCMMTGDMVETSGSNNSEWEWEQWFERMQPVWKHTPIAPICGNHDKSSNKNLTHHFNTEKVGFDQELSTTPGSVYSFVYGDALFIAASTEDYSKAGYLDSLKNFIRAEVAAHPEVKWKIAFYHKAIYTGSRSHQSDRDARTVREALVPVFDEVGIDMCFQGHDHIYEVMGATKEFKLVENSSWGIEDAALRGVRENMTGKQGGVYDVSNGTLFFLNNSAGKKKYEPRNEAEMEAAYSAHGITNYWGLFTGKFGQTGEPTYSDVRVTRDTLFVQTYTVDDAGTATLFDAFKVVKSEKVEELPTQSLAATRASIALIPNPTSSSVEVQGLESVDAMELYTLAGMRLQQSTASTRLSVEGCTPGTYVVKVYSGNDVFVEKLLVQ